MLIDARKAHLNPKCEEDVYVTLPEECECPEGMCAKLNYWLYGFRPAAAAWEKHYSEKFESVGFTRGTSCGVVFYHKERDIRAVIHGDDFTMLASNGQLDWFQENQEQVRNKGKRKTGTPDQRPEVNQDTQQSGHMDRKRN